MKCYLIVLIIWFSQNLSPIKAACPSTPTGWVHQCSDIEDKTIFCCAKTIDGIAPCTCRDDGWTCADADQTFLEGCTSYRTASNGVSYCNDCDEGANNLH